MKNIIEKEIKESIRVKQSILNNPELIFKIKQASDIIIKGYKKSKKTILAGNGGSAADAQHIAGEFVSRFYFDRPGLASIALTTDTSILTAIGNDYGYERLFARQIEANGNEGDIFIGISTSGNSQNVLEAIKICTTKNIFTIGFTGETPNQMEELCDLCINIPSKDTPRIQECHILIGHIICGIVENKIFSDYISK